MVAVDCRAGLVLRADFEHGALWLGNWLCLSCANELTRISWKEEDNSPICLCQLGKVAGAPLGAVMMGPYPESAAEVRALGEEEPQWHREHEWELQLLLLLDPEWTGKGELRVLEVWVPLRGSLHSF